MIRFYRVLLPFAAVLGLTTLGTAAAGPPAAVVAVVTGVTSAANSDNAQRVGSYFTPRSFVIDDIAPYTWSGSGAGMRWWTAVHTTLARANRSRLHVTVRPITRYRITGSVAYVVVPLHLVVTASGRARTLDGLWALTLERTGGAWKISSAAFADE